MDGDTNPTIPEPTAPQPAGTKERSRIRVILKIVVGLLVGALPWFAIRSFITTADEQNDGRRPTQIELADAFRQNAELTKSFSFIDESVRPQFIDDVITCMGDRLVKSDLPDALLRKLAKGENPTVNSSRVDEYEQKLKAIGKQCGEEAARKILTP